MNMHPREDDFSRILNKKLYGMSTEIVEAEISQITRMLAEDFSASRAELSMDDTDRAFDLMTQAVEIIDYGLLQLRSEEDYAEEIKKAVTLLEKALDLDPKCLDAQRILVALRNQQPNKVYDFLVSQRTWAKETAESVAKDILKSKDMDLYQGNLWTRPYLRWLNMTAQWALLCGHYRSSLEVSEELLTLDSSDPCGVAATALYAAVKLEDNVLVMKYGKMCGQQSPWTKLAALFMCYKNCDYETARVFLQDLLNIDRADDVLSNLVEFPPGLFSRPLVLAETADEVALAVSEAAVIIDECGTAAGRSPLAQWIITQAYGKESFMPNNLEEKK